MATKPRPTTGDSNVESRVRVGLLTVVYNDQPLSLVTAVAFALIIAAVISFTRPAGAPWIWAAGLVAVALARLWQAHQFRREFGADNDPTSWERRLLIGATATAAFWGWVGWYGYEVGTPLSRTCVLMLLGGVVAASSRTLAAHFATFLVYVVVASAPLLTQLLLEHERGGLVLATFALLYVTLMLVLGYSFRQLVSRAFRLQFENADLAARLQRDVAARAAAETALQESQTRLKLAQFALDHAQDMVAVCDRDGAFFYVNQAFSRYVGRSSADLATMKVWEKLIPADAEGFQAQWDEVKRAGAATFEGAIVRADGTHVPVEVNASYVQLSGREAVCMIARDLSARQAAEAERSRLQQQLQETQRLESLGVLAGGVAHDFNNLLTAILGNATLARDSLNDPRMVKDMLAQVETAANQAAGLCRQMLAYAGHGQLRIEALNISTIVLDSAKLLEMTIAHRARLELQLAPALPSIMADASQLRQVVLNLVHNAAEAMERPNGAIIVTTSAVAVDQALISTSRVRSEIKPGAGVSLVVKDNGSGMAPETLERIFEPFFTTKFTGRGLGLPAVLGIVRSHRGLLHVDSKRGVGSTFRVTFLASEKSAPAVNSAPSTVARAQGGRALVVEDEEPVRRVAQQVLLRMGYEVDTATDGASAVTRVTRDPTRYDLVLVDMTMPRMDGAVTLQQMRRLGLTAPCILMSGLAEQQVRAKLGDVTGVTFLQKPFDLTTLTNAAQAAVAGSKP